MQRISTAGHPDIAFLSVPVQVKGSPDLGHYVAAVDVRLAFQPIIRTHLTYAAVALVALVAIGIVGYQVAGKLLSPLRSLRRTAQRITETDLSEADPGRPAGRRRGRRPRSDDELHAGPAVGVLPQPAPPAGRRRPRAQDPGHHRPRPPRAARPAQPDEEDETRDPAIDELDRMRRLVDDIVLLAKTSPPGFLRPQQVDVADLLAGVLAKAVALGDRNWLLASPSNES